MIFIFENINFGNFIKERYIDFNIIDNVPLTMQKESLKEDMLQIIYENNYIIDIGWYPEFDENGSFKITLIKDHCWDKPLFEKKCRDVNKLREYLCLCIKNTQL